MGLPYQEQQHISLSKLPIQGGYVVFIAREGRAIQKEFKKKSNAMKFAMKYMRKH